MFHVSRCKQPTARINIRGHTVHIKGHTVHIKGHTVHMTIDTGASINVCGVIRKTGKTKIKRGKYKGILTIIKNQRDFMVNLLPSLKTAITVGEVFIIKSK